jgi:starch phosphorylase
MDSQGAAARVGSRRDGTEDVAQAVALLASRIPAELAPLARVAYNYGWSWAPGGPELFREIDPDRWETSCENPVRLLLETPVKRLTDAAANAGLVDRARRLEAVLHADLARPFAEGPFSPERPAAFVCAEFGVHRSLYTYAGGLGVLAGDFLKQASDLALPFVAVGLLYRQGYFRQRLDTSGWQYEYWFDADPGLQAMALVTGEDGAPATFSVNLRGRDVRLQLWRVNVGRVPLYLIDSDRPENSRADRWITSRLYVGDREVRLAQYALLGIGGIRALRCIGIDPGLIHLNEGHAALATLELIREGVADGLGFDAALEAARSRVVFTTHTPVPAGNEYYPAADLARVLGDFPAALGIDAQKLYTLGRSHPGDEEPVGMTQLAIRTSRSVNGVSRRHGEVAREMWHHLWPDLPREKIPIGYVTNGVHVPTWIAPAMRALFARHLGEGWEARADDAVTWSPIPEIPDEEIWSVRNALRAALVAYVRDRSVIDRLSRGETSDYVEAAARSFDANILTIGFARRVATYKRLHLFTYDPDRGLKLLQGKHPVQFLVAGKAHPRDEEAKRNIQMVFSLKGGPGVAERVAYLEDYDMGLASHLVRGCDLWINLPRPPLEASGTSGMKSALNGGLNLSVLDGWWEEGYDGMNGWAIPSDPTLAMATQDTKDIEELFSLLEQEVVPLFYDRDAQGIPRGWIRRIKASLCSIGPTYNAARMLEDYLQRVYANRT